MTDRQHAACRHTAYSMQSRQGSMQHGNAARSIQEHGSLQHGNAAYSIQEHAEQHAAYSMSNAA